MSEPIVMTDDEYAVWAQGRISDLEAKLEALTIDNGILTSRCEDLHAKVDRQAEQITRLETSRQSLRSALAAAQQEQEGGGEILRRGKVSQPGPSLKIHVGPYDPLKGAREAGWALFWGGELWGTPVMYTGEENDERITEEIFEMLVDNFNQSFERIKAQGTLYADDLPEMRPLRPATQNEPKKTG